MKAVFIFRRKLTGAFRRAAFSALLLSFANQLPAQQVNNNRYGLSTIADISSYHEMVKADSLKTLVNLAQYIPGIKMDIRYATAFNFLGEPVYKTAEAWLSLPAAKALKNAERQLNEKGLGLKIFDAYRPYRVTVLFYEKVKDTVFVASPYRGSRHNRGAAVDLTLIDLRTGKELAMPTAFDDFTKKAHTSYSNLPAHVIANRELLKATMVNNGFEIYTEEWWHFDYRGWRSLPLLDLEFELLDD
jgi:D-alanyl-D-alanine dipeptidase